MIRRVGGVGLAADGFNTWSLPGGWLDFGESPEQAAEREVLEETGVVVKAESRAGYLVNHSERTIVTLFIRCEYVSGEPTITEPDKCQDVQWLTWPQVKDGRPLFAPFRDWLESGKQKAKASS
jgi:8-oxo-dGTP diphosphatase